MPLKLNPQCKRLFMEFVAKKYPYEYRGEESSFDFAKYPLLSKSFFYAAKYPRPVFYLVIDVGGPKFIEVSFSDAVECGNSFYFSRYGLNVTLDNFHKILMFLNPSTVCVNRCFHDLPPEVENIFDNYGGKLIWDLGDAYYKQCTRLINKWSPKISLLRTHKEFLLDGDTMPLKLDCCYLNSLIVNVRQDNLLRILDRHKIKRLNVKASLIFYDGEEVQPKNIGSLKYLKARVTSGRLRFFVDFLIRNNFNLTQLSLEVQKRFLYSDQNSISSTILEAYNQVLELNERCSKLVRKQLHVKMNVDAEPDVLVEFKQEWIEALCNQCIFLKEAEYDADDGRHILKTQIASDEDFKLDLNIEIRS